MARKAFILVAAFLSLAVACTSPNQVVCSEGDENCTAQEARRAFYESRFEDAEALVKTLDWKRSSHPDLLETATYLIVFQRKLGNELAVAEELALQRVEVLPEDPESYVILGNVLMAMLREEDAVDALEQARRKRGASGQERESPFDVVFAPAFHTTGRYTDVLMMFGRAQRELGDDAWLQDDVVLSALSSAAQLRRWQEVARLMDNVRARRPDLAASEEFREFERWVDSIEK
jgi:tetratricopeptide (TPR) repeat protein